ncbi:MULTISPECIES: transposase [Corynebacterium]|uniref:transposase n=1 Tax=Corynebacterium TaxID=1716 RepID=UPI00124CA937
MSKGWSFPPTVRTQVVDEFVTTWKSYGSPSAAAASIGKTHGVSKTTVYSWVADAGQWPVTRAARVLKLEAENAQLREEIRRLRACCERVE